MPDVKADPSLAAIKVVPLLAASSFIKSSNVSEVNIQAKVHVIAIRSSNPAGCHKVESASCKKSILLGSSVANCSLQGMGVDHQAKMKTSK